MSQTNWTVIEQEYRAGQLSLRAIASAHGITAPAISQKAKREGWQRNLAESVRQRTKAKIAKATLKVNEDSDDNIVETASERAKRVGLEHIKSLQRYRNLADKLYRSLDRTEVDDDNQDKFARTLNSAADVLAKIIKMERQALNMEEIEEKEDAAGPSLCITLTREDEDGNVFYEKHHSEYKT